VIYSPLNHNPIGWSIGETSANVEFKSKDKFFEKEEIQYQKKSRNKQIGSSCTVPIERSMISLKEDSELFVSKVENFISTVQNRFPY
jgi:hypothetical protein